MSDEPKQMGRKICYLCHRPFWPGYCTGVALTWREQKGDLLTREWAHLDCLERAARDFDRRFQAERERAQISIVKGAVHG